MSDPRDAGVESFSDAEHIAWLQQDRDALKRALTIALAERDARRMAEHKLSAAYLRLRALIPGAFDTPHAPTAEQVWDVTETALRRALTLRKR